MSLNLTGFVSPLMEQASNLFGHLIPVFAIGAGITLGVVLVVLVVKAIQSILPHG